MPSVPCTAFGAFRSRSFVVWLGVVAVAAMPMRAVALSSSDADVPPVAVRASSDYSVVSTWVSSGHGDPRILHVRVSLHPERTTTFSPDHFSLRVVSRGGATSTVYALAETAPSKRKLNFTSAEEIVSVPEVSADEDFGDRGAVRVRRGDSMTLVLSFRILSDGDLRGAASTLQYRP